jgi:hypothetical protein
LFCKPRKHAVQSWFLWFFQRKKPKNLQAQPVAAFSEPFLKIRSLNRAVWPGAGFQKRRFFLKPSVLIVEARGFPTANRVLGKARQFRNKFNRFWFEDIP